MTFKAGLAAFVVYRISFIIISMLYLALDVFSQEVPFKAVSGSPLEPLKGLGECSYLEGLPDDMIAEISDLLEPRLGGIALSSTSKTVRQRIFHKQPGYKELNEIRASIRNKMPGFWSLFFYVQLGRDLEGSEFSPSTIVNDALEILMQFDHSDPQHWGCHRKPEASFRIREYCSCMRPFIPIPSPRNALFYQLADIFEPRKDMLLKNIWMRLNLRFEFNRLKTFYGQLYNSMAMSRALSFLTFQQLFIAISYENLKDLQIFLRKDPRLEMTKDEDLSEMFEPLQSDNNTTILIASVFGLVYTFLGYIGLMYLFATSKFTHDRSLYLSFYHESSLESFLENSWIRKFVLNIVLDYSTNLCIDIMCVAPLTSLLIKIFPSFRQYSWIILVSKILPFYLKSLSQLLFFLAITYAPCVILIRIAFQILLVIVSILLLIMHLINA